MYVPRQSNLALLVCAFLTFWTDASMSHSGRSTQRNQNTAVSPKAHPDSEVYLTGVRPTVCIPVDLTNLQGRHLAITLLRVNNPDRVAFSVLVALEPQAAAKEEKCRDTNETVSSCPSSVLLGDLGVFPPDQPGHYKLDVSTSLKHLRNCGQNLANLRLRLTLKRLHPQQPPNRLEVVLSPPEWTDENP